MRIFGIGALVGAITAWFLDPAVGRRRRHATRNRVAAVVRRGTRRGARAGRFAAAKAYGLKQKVTHLREAPKSFDDATLKEKVETNLFRSADAPKDRVSVNAQNGVVQLRGELDSPDLIADLVAKARSINGVRDVENLLHLPGQPAPMHQ
jgi:osmotically-inducible protein OsmY